MARDKEAEKEFLDKLALYRDSFEEFAHELPNDVGRNLSKVREVNHQQHRLINSLNVLKDELTNKEMNEDVAVQMLSKAEHILVEFLQLNEEKMEYTQTITDLLQEVKLDLDCKYQRAASAAETISKETALSLNNDNGGECSQKTATSTATKKRRKGKKSKSSDTVDESDEEIRYCSCKQLSFGEMILCDNEQCSIQWFHFECVELTNKPRGRWYCPACRGHRSNIRKKQ